MPVLFVGISSAGAQKMMHNPQLNGVWILTEREIPGNALPFVSFENQQLILEQLHRYRGNR